MQLILLSEPVWIKICGEIDEISRKVLITGVIGYDSIRKHLHIKERIIPSYIHLTDMHIFLWDRGRRAKSISLLKKFLVTEHLHLPAAKVKMRRQRNFLNERHT